MSYVSQDQLLDTIGEAQRDLQRALDKLDDGVKSELEALELRAERNISATAKRAAASAIMSPEFQLVQEDVDELKDMLRDFGKQLKRMWAAIEEMALLNDTNT